MAEIPFHASQIEIYIEQLLFFFSGAFLRVAPINFTRFFCCWFLFLSVWTNFLQRFRLDAGHGHGYMDLSISRILKSVVFMVERRMRTAERRRKTVATIARTATSALMIIKWQHWLLAASGRYLIWCLALLCDRKLNVHWMNRDLLMFRCLFWLVLEAVAREASMRNSLKLMASFNTNDKADVCVTVLGSNPTKIWRPVTAYHRLGPFCALNGRRTHQFSTAASMWGRTWLDPISAIYRFSPMETCNLA